MIKFGHLESFQIGSYILLTWSLWLLSYFPAQNILKLETATFPRMF